MKQISDKENLMMFMRGEHPLWVPRYYILNNPYTKHPNAALMCSPSFLDARRTREGGFDIWGVEFVTTAETGWMAMPKPNQFILDDIRKWRDVVKAPDISGLDWEEMAKKDLKPINRETTAVVGSLNFGYFQQLMAFMGFSEGLCAMYEEPEEVKALLDYISDFFLEVAKKTIHYYKPDIMALTDDTATALNPFISVGMYRELIKPYHLKQCKPAIDAGIPVMMHNCGRCEDFIDDWFDLGVTAWNPAQVMNDLDGIKKKYGNKLGLCGCWDSSGKANWDDATEEYVRQTVRDTIDRFASGGGFCFWGSIYGPPDSVVLQNRKRWITEEYDSYGRNFYNK